MAGGQELKAVLKLAGTIDPSLQKALRQAAKEAGEVEKKGGGIGKAFSTGGKAAGAAVAAIGTAATAAAAAVGAAAIKMAKGAINVGMSFESGMSQVAATMGVAVDEIEVLSDKAKEMGATTKFTATEAAEAMNYMALAGWDVEKQMAGIEPILSAAAAGGLELGYASDLVTDSMSALGLSFDELPGFVDQISKASQKANANIAQLGEGILTVGGTAKSLAGGTTELNTVLGLLADNGVKGSEGGTALRNTILSLAAPTDAAADELNRLGVQVSDAEGNLLPLQDIIGELGSAMDGLGNVERSEILNTIFNKRDIKSVEALLGTTTERWNELNDAIANSEGAASQQAETLRDNLQGDIDLFKSAMEGAGIEIYEAMAPALREIVQGATGFISGMTENGQLDQLADVFGEVMDAAAELARSSLPGFLSLLGKLLSSLGSALTSVLPDLIAMGSAILPVLMEAFQQLIPPVMSIISTILPILSQLIASLAPIIASVLVQLAPLIELAGAVLVQILQPLMPIISLLIQQLLPPIIALISAVLMVIEPLIPVLMGILTWLSPIIQDVARLIQLIAELIAWVSGGISKVVDFFAGIFGGAKQAAEATDELGDSMNNLPAGGEITMPEVVIPEVDTAALTVEIPPVDATAYAGSIDELTAQAMTEVPEIGDAFTDAAQTAVAEAQDMNSSAGQALKELSKTGIQAMDGLKNATLSAFTGMQNSLNGFLNGLKQVVAGMRQAAGAAANVSMSAGGASVGMAYGGILRATAGGIPVHAAEAGYDEAFIPINQSPRSIGLLAETAARMGFNLYGGSSGGFSYNPTVVVNGNASQQDVQNALTMSREEFFAMMDEYNRERGRTGFDFELAQAY